MHLERYQLRIEIFRFFQKRIQELRLAIMQQEEFQSFLSLLVRVGHRLGNSTPFMPALSLPLPIPSATRIEGCAEVFKAAASIRIFGND